MPTENRSSNTEQMFSVPEGYMLVERSIWTEQQVEAATACITLLKVVPGMRDRDLAMAAIDAAQCKAPDIRLSDLLTAAQPLGWVYEGGQEFTSDPDRAHDLRAEGIDLTAVYGLAQHQGEPVALPARKDTTQHWAEPGGVHKTEGWNAYHEELARLGPLYTHPAPFQQGEPVAFYREFVDGREYCEKPFTNDWTPLYAHSAPAVQKGEPDGYKYRRKGGNRAWTYSSSGPEFGVDEFEVHKLYTHPDAGEVERLRERLNLVREQRDDELCTSKDLESERDTLLAQLAEAESKLIDKRDDLRASVRRRERLVRMLAERDTLLLEALCHAQRVEPMSVSLFNRIDAALSASTEPSAPAERDERAEFEADQRSKGFAIDILPGTVATYMVPAVRFAWAGWQARAALERKS